MHFFLTNGWRSHKKVSNRKNAIRVQFVPCGPRSSSSCKSTIIFIFYGSCPNICGDLAGWRGLSHKRFFLFSFYFQRFAGFIVKKCINSAPPMRTICISQSVAAANSICFLYVPGRRIRAQPGIGCDTAEVWLWCGRTALPPVNQHNGQLSKAG